MLKRIMGGAAGVAVAILPAMALEFPGTCISPPATVTTIAGIDTRSAKMEGRFTLPDIVAACHAGYVDQSGNAPDDVEDCIGRYSQLTNSQPLVAVADCVEGSITIEGFRTKLPAHYDCASGGICAIDAFNTLCPSYGGEIRLED